MWDQQMTITEEGDVPDFLRMDQPLSSDPAFFAFTGDCHFWTTN
jgi:hypothetical protein